MILFSDEQHHSTERKINVIGLLTVQLYATLLIWLKTQPNRM